MLCLFRVFWSCLVSRFELTRCRWVGSWHFHLPSGWVWYDFIEIDELDRLATAAVVLASTHQSRLIVVDWQSSRDWCCGTRTSTFVECGIQNVFVYFVLKWTNLRYFSCILGVDTLVQTFKSSILTWKVRKRARACRHNKTCRKIIKKVAKE